MQVLQFSGGLDSLVCLHLLRDEEDMCVVTVSTDGAYPERAEYLARVKAAFPRLAFHEARSDRKLREFGHPVDVVPLRWTAVGQLVRGGRDVRYQDAFSCCQRAIWMPMHMASVNLGATTIIRGQRGDDELGAPIGNGDVIEGVEYRLPLQDWSRELVRDYAREWLAGLVPAYYAQGEKTSRDCWDCTAYLADNGERIRNLPPEQFKRVNGLLARWRDDVMTETGA